METIEQDKVVVRMSRKKLPKQNVFISVLQLFKQCQVDACPIKKFCEHTKYGYCGFEMEFIGNILGPYMKVLDRNPDPYYAMIFGMQIVPLYLDLARMTKTEYGLSRTDTADHKGNVKIHPVYRQKADLVMTINQTMKQSGFLDFMRKSGCLGGKGGMEEQNENLHDILMESGE